MTLDELCEIVRVLHLSAQVGQLGPPTGACSIAAALRWLRLQDTPACHGVKQPTDEASTLQRQHRRMVGAGLTPQPAEAGRCSPGSCT